MSTHMSVHNKDKKVKIQSEKDLISSGLFFIHIFFTTSKKDSPLER